MPKPLVGSNPRFGNPLKRKAPSVQNLLAPTLLTVTAADFQAKPSGATPRRDAVGNSPRPVSKPLTGSQLRVKEQAVRLGIATQAACEQLAQLRRVEREKAKRGAA